VTGTGHDGPTSGLDPVGRRLVRALIHDLRARHDRRPLRWSHRWRGRPALWARSAPSRSPARPWSAARWFIWELGWRRRCAGSGAAIY